MYWPKDNVFIEMSSLLTNGEIQTLSGLRLCFVLSKGKPVSYLSTSSSPDVYCTAGSDHWLHGLWCELSNILQIKVKPPRVAPHSYLASTSYSAPRQVV